MTPPSPYYIKLYVRCAHTLAPSFDQLGRQKTPHISLWWWDVHIGWRCCQVEQRSQTFIYVVQVGQDGRLWFVGVQRVGFYVMTRMYDYNISWISCGLILTPSWAGQILEMLRNDLHCFCHTVSLFERWHPFWCSVRLWMTEPCCFWLTQDMPAAFVGDDMFTCLSMCVLCMSLRLGQSNWALVGECICSGEWQRHCGYRGMVALME